MNQALNVISKHVTGLSVRFATPDDVGLILNFIKDLAVYEKLAHEVVATESTLQTTLFGPKRYAEVVIAEYENTPAGFALFFHNYSTFLAKPGLYLEDLFVDPKFRAKGIGKAMLVYLAQLAKDRGCGRFEWSVLNWNEPAIRLYKNLGAMPMDDWTIYRQTGDELERLALERF